MEWVDNAIVLGARPFGEGKLVAEVFSREHGRFGGVVHAGRKSLEVHGRPLTRPHQIQRRGGRRSTCAHDSWFVLEVLGHRKRWQQGLRARRSHP